MMSCVHLGVEVVRRWTLSVAASICLSSHVHLIHLLRQLLHWILTVEAFSWLHLHWLRTEIAAIGFICACFKHVNLCFELLSNVEVFILDSLSFQSFKLSQLLTNRLKTNNRIFYLFG